MSTRGGHSKVRRTRAAEHEEHENSERWLISYSDMLTVLMALFIVLFAISQVDQQKFVALRQALATGFNNATASSDVLAGNDGVLESSSYLRQDLTTSGGAQDPVAGTLGLGTEAADPTAAIPTGAPTPAASASAVDPDVLAAARQEVAHLEQVRDELAHALAARGLAGAVQFQIDQRGLVLGLVADDVFFDSASAVLTPTAGRLLDSIAPTFRGLSESISVEGNANVIPVSGQYASNWELSADRATKVLRRLVETGRVPGGRIAAVGYGDTRPLVAGTSSRALAANRRVDLVVLSSAPERVRALLPSLATES
jgi:chemotaxis protein MotB